MSIFRLSKLKSMVDEVCNISLTKIQSSKVSLYSYIDHNGSRFSSMSHHFTDPILKSICLSSSPSISGHYIGIDPMGFMWSMKPEPNARPGCRLLIRNVSENFKINLEAYHGHVDIPELSEDRKIAEATLERTYLSDQVEKVYVHHGRIRGALFYPKNCISAPGIIDLFGYGGGLIETRAALLASKGFTTLALAYFGYDDLPKSFKTMDLSYFEEAVDFMHNHSKVTKDYLGTVGVSKGSEICCLMSILFGDKIKASVLLNGIPYPTDLPAEYKDFYMKSKGFAHELKDYVIMTPKGAMIRNIYDCYNNELYPIEKASCRFLLVSCLDDHSVPTETSDVYADKLIAANRNNFKILRYPLAGHLIEPPYMPLCDSAYVKLFNTLVSYGGDPFHHNLAQIQLWQEIQQFFKTYLGNPICD